MPLDDTLKRGASGYDRGHGAARGTVARADAAGVPPRLARGRRTRARGIATDDAALVEALGHRVHVSEGDPVNLKITTPRDLELGRGVAQPRAPERTT